ncbi:MAG: hypothetical protein L0G46_07640 [Kocuria sp.]|nr:hypothetical protein [Kocuria sp.]
MTSIMENRWTRRVAVIAAMALTALFIVSTGTAFAAGGVEFDPTPEEIPGMSGLTKLINYTAWGVAIIGGIAFLATIGWLAVSVFSGQEIRAGKGMIITIGALILLGAAGAIVGAFM